MIKRIRSVSYLDQYVVGSKLKQSMPASSMDLRKIVCAPYSQQTKQDQLNLLRMLVPVPTKILSVLEKKQIVPKGYKPGFVLMGELEGTASYQELWGYYTGEGLPTGKMSVVENEYTSLSTSQPLPLAAFTLSEIQQVVREVLNWRPSLLDGQKLINTLTFNEINVVIRQIMKVLIYNDVFRKDYNPHAKTNREANVIALETLKKLDKLDLKNLMKVRTRAGVVDFNNPEMQERYQKEGVNFIKRMLETAQEDEFVIDHFAAFEEYSRPENRKRMAWFHDNNGEATLDLAVIMRLLARNTHLTVASIPKKIQVSNDFSYQDFQELIPDPYFQPLRDFHAQGRFKVIESGPEIQGIDLGKISLEVARELLSAHMVVLIGQANLETTNMMNKLPCLEYRIYNYLVKGFTLQAGTGIHAKAGKEGSPPMVLAKVENGDMPVQRYADSKHRTVVSPLNNQEIKVAGRTLWEYVLKSI